MTTTTYLDAPPMREAKDEDPSNLGLAGYAKILCSALFVSGHEEEFARAHARRVAVDLMHLPRGDLDRLTDRDRLRRQDRDGIARRRPDPQGRLLRRPGVDSPPRRP